MSAQPKRVTRPDVWTRWEGHVVKGIFPLRRFLGSSEQGAVFLSEYAAGKVADAAIKLVPAVASRAEAQIAHWRAAFTLSHPHLVRLFDMGRCQLEGRDFLFVVMEYGEQTLAQFLAQRTLSASEVRALLLPTLDALSFLHGSQLVHARLRPSNFLVVDDQLKLSSDAVRPAGYSAGTVRSTGYDPPELTELGVSAAGDIWSLGVTLIEAFTQRIPGLTDDQYEASSLLANVPAQFATTVRRCLNPTPGARPSITEIQEQYKASLQSDDPEEGRAQAHPLLLAMPAALLIAFLAVIGRSPSGKPPAEARTSPAIAAPAPAPKTSKPAAATAKPARTVSENSRRESSRPESSRRESSRPESSRAEVARSESASPRSGSSRLVLREVIPEVPRALRNPIQGRILVTIRVLVDPSGNVMAVMMEKAGPNRNLASLADQAAREWKFAPADQESNRVWILTFAFTREDVTARATAV